MGDTVRLKIVKGSLEIENLTEKVIFLAGNEDTGFFLITHQYHDIDDIKANFTPGLTKVRMGPLGSLGEHGIDNIKILENGWEIKMGGASIIRRGYRYFFKDNEEGEEKEILNEDIRRTISWEED
ncbi:hypothetical protein GF382_03105 [Candidatus Falkowbacteria bacterium]|nr:hypothetical protein [Candidatus Falkowbacteria bacterium]